ncbi:MAG: EAL domain-containing protein [Ruminococcus sp.]|uniref:putative bifunctional diguanylate cyclase/phosphodiesterase n=1 Tax=Ruminococcus sp. TaxID=41978 RepID=UPI001B2B80AE|nr:EAL domain-containing protein [Ruminococcus sp.]MBO7473466.1 EAL domain-containing protein [Ruminococcus sp.]
MKKDTRNKKILERTINRLSVRKKAPLTGYILLIVFYIIGSITVSILARSKAEISLFGFPLPFYSFAGVCSVVSEICVLFMAFYYGKKGYFTALVLLIIQTPMVLMGVFVQHKLTSLPGIFGNLLTIIAITSAYINNLRVERFQKELRYQAVTDQLTGLPNRFACSKLVAALVEKGDKFAFVSIDINGFKGINDTMGFDAGNKILNEIASRWENIADNGISGTLDFISRVSGDEFVLVIRDYQLEEDILNTIKQYENVLHNRITVDDTDLYVNASFGFAEFPYDANSVDNLGNYANAAMHEVKRSKSSNHILRFTPELLKAERTIEIEGKIRDALKKETLFYNLQPQFNMDHKLRGFEALARMKDADGNFISPGEFIPVAEKVGLVDKVDEMVFRKSALFFGELLRKTGADIVLSVNVSVRHLMKNDFFDEICEVLKTSGVPADKLEIEITESIMIDSVDKALQCIDQLKARGIKIAIDDFGTGYSSLSYLNRFPANLLKIDKSFIDKMNTSDSSRQYVSAIISIGHTMGFKVISEGVEETEQIQTLREIGCDYIQGFVWGRPMMPDAAEELVVNEMKG